MSATDTPVLDESWTTSSGLPLADADVEIADLKFGYPAQLGGTTLAAIITFRMIDTGDETEQFFSVGQNWDQINKGAALEKNGGTGKQTFSGQSNFGRLIDSAVKTGAGATLGSRGQTYQADTWIGSKWHTGTVKVISRNPTTGAESEKDAIVFESFLGLADDAAPAAATNGNGKASGSKSKAATAAELDAALEAELLTLAASSETHDDFMAAALEIAAVADSKDATNAVMNSGKGSIWMRGNA